MVQWLICDHQINCRCENNTTNGLSVRKARPLIEYTDASINSLLLVGLQVPKWDVSLIVIYTAAAESRSAYFFGNCPQTIISLYRRRIVRNAPCIHCGMMVKILDVGIQMSLYHVSVSAMSASEPAKRHKSCAPDFFRTRFPPSDWFF